MPLTAEDVAAIETVAHYTHDEDQCYLMLYGTRALRPRPPLSPKHLPGNGERERGASVERLHLFCARLLRTGEGVFDTIPIEADYTVGDMKLWLKTHKQKDPAEYDLVGPKV